MLIQSSQTNLALGSEVIFTLTFDKSDTDKANELFERLWQTTYQFERRFSRFLPTSELSTFNKAAGLRTPLSLEFAEILTVAKQLSERTNGLFNPFVLPALQRAGYTKSFAEGYADDIHDDHSFKQVVTIDKLEIGDNWASIPYGTALDLGGCGKGYLADILANNMPNDWVKGFWLSVGGDVVGEGLDVDQKPWDVAIYNTGKTHDWHIPTFGKRFAIATSGTSERKGAGWHHIIDPVTQKPAKSDIATATICAESGVEADVLASCVIIIGSKKASAFLKKGGVRAALIRTSDHVARDIVFGDSIHKKAGLYA
jgi:thiamine biosynthesis lipoprotein